MKQFKNKSGFTLIEFILVIALSALVFLVLAQSAIVTLRSWDIALSGSTLIGQTEVGFSRMAREIRQVRNDTSLSIAQPTQIGFTDVNNSPIEYRLVGGQLRRNQNVAIDDVASLTFEYLDENGTIIASPFVAPAATNVRMVRMTITVVPSSQSMTLQSLVRLRNLR